MYITFSLSVSLLREIFLCFTLKLLAWSSCGLGLGTCDLVNIPAADKKSIK